MGPPGRVKAWPVPAGDLQLAAMLRPTEPVRKHRRPMAGSSGLLLSVTKGARSTYGGGTAFGVFSAKARHLDA